MTSLARCIKGERWLYLSTLTPWLPKLENRHKIKGCSEGFHEVHPDPVLLLNRIAACSVTAQTLVWKLPLNKSFHYILPFILLTLEYPHVVLAGAPCKVQVPLAPR